MRGNVGEEGKARGRQETRRDGGWRLLALPLRTRRGWWERRTDCVHALCEAMSLARIKWGSNFLCFWDVVVSLCALETRKGGSTTKSVSGRMLASAAWQCQL